MESPGRVLANPGGGGEPRTVTKRRQGSRPPARRAVAAVFGFLFLLAVAGLGGCDRQPPSSITTTTGVPQPGAPSQQAPPTTTTTPTAGGAIPTPQAPATTAPPPAGSARAGIALVAQLSVAPETPRAGFARSLFPHWSDLDDDRCDAREEVLLAESLRPPQVDPPTCRVLAGEWFSAYDGLRTTNPRSLDIDHVVALAEAWDSGASRWDTARRQAFANDIEAPASLIAVSAASNRAKGDDDPAEWRPPRREAWCSFASDWASTKARWALSADAAEVAALQEMMATCAG